MLQDVSVEVVDQLHKQNEREREEMSSIIDVEKREAEGQVTRQYMSHFLIGIKVTFSLLS